MEPPSREENPI